MGQPVLYHYGRFPPTNIQWDKLISLIGPATGALTRYDGVLSVIRNPSVLLSPLTTQEAVLSSRIEGTQATLGEVLEYEAEKDGNGFPEEKKEDIFEILNYRQAIWKAVELLKKLPLCGRVICEAHRVLNKAPGEYRKTQNWIGPHGCSLEQARFVPISPDQLPDGISAWEKYIHQETPDKLVQLAVLHAEFEALHPFYDGNGRIGRLFVPLFLYKTELIKSPTFYISAYFEANREEYYERLLAVSRDNDWTGWCQFFLKAIESQARENQEKATKILQLYEEKKNQIQEITRSQYTLHILDFIFENPIFKATTLAKIGKIPESSAKKLLIDLRNANVIKTLKQASGRRAAVFVFHELLNIAEGREVF
ncbi:MAG: Fic/DOC family N-terminal domain-containing protein [Anaerohalosphaeraceae bacterium]